MISPVQNSLRYLSNDTSSYRRDEILTQWSKKWTTFINGYHSFHKSILPSIEVKNDIGKKSLEDIQAKEPNDQTINQYKKMFILKHYLFNIISLDQIFEDLFNYLTDKIDIPDNNWVLNEGFIIDRSSVESNIWAIIIDHFINKFREIIKSKDDEKAILIVIESVIEKFKVNEILKLPPNLSFIHCFILSMYLNSDTARTYFDQFLQYSIYQPTQKIVDDQRTNKLLIIFDQDNFN